MWKRLPLLLFLGLLVLFPSSLAYPAESLWGLAQPHLFAIARWEGASLLAKGEAGIRDLFNALPPEQESQLIRGYFLEGKPIPLPRVEAALEGQMGKLLKEEGFSFPPLLFRLDSPPHLLIISPRERIELQQAILLDSELTPEELETLEKRVERMGISTLVERVGGIATFPSLVQPSGLESALAAIAHEWAHHYLFLYPLGRNYGRTPEMTTINESAAELVGKEMASRLLPRFGLEPRKEEPAQADPFRQKLRAIRLAVEDYLARGEVERAEAFMEERRQALAQEGHYIRRLNQAYFAFYGSYADSPASVSPIGDELRALRAQSPSLGEFLRKLAKVSSYDELKQLLGPERAKALRELSERLQINRPYLSSFVRFNICDC